MPEAGVCIGAVDLLLDLVPSRGSWLPTWAHRAPAVAQSVGDGVATSWISTNLEHWRPGANVQLKSVRESQQRRESSASIAPQSGWEQRRMSNLTSRRHEKRTKCTSRKHYAAKGAVEP